MMARTKLDSTAPSVDGQAKVIAEAMSLAGVHPETIDYIEGHGTGTPLGDPIEIAALLQVFRAKTKANAFLRRRLGQDQYRPRGRSSRGRRTDQDGAGARAPNDPGEPSFPPAKSSNRL